MTARPRRLAEPLAAALLVLLVGGAAVGVARYVEARDHHVAVQRALGAAAEQLAARVAAGHAPAAADLDGALGGPGRVAVVQAGQEDTFGISRGAAITADVVTDDALKLADKGLFASQQALLDESARLESLVTAGTPIPRERREAFVERGEAAGGGLLAVAVAPVLRPGDPRGYLGMVVVARAAPPVAPATSLWMVILAALVAFTGSIMLQRTRLPARAAGALAVALPAAAPLLLFSPVLAAWTAGAAALAGALALAGLAALLRGLREQPTTYLYVGPAVAALVVLVFVPFFMGTAIAFFDAEGTFVGLDHFREVLAPGETTGTSFYWTLFITVLWTVSNVLLHVTLGVALALVLNRPSLRWKGLYRVLLIVPWAVPNYITALIWKMMFTTQQGAVNAFLALFGVERIDWLGQDVATNFLANLVTNTWLGFPFMMVVTLGALQSIPKDLYEAAEIDGAGRWQRFRHVTLPLLKPALLPAVILGSIWTFNMFNVIYLVSGGAPDGQTHILITEAYHSFKVLQRYGYAAAYAVIIFLILYAYGKLTDRIARATEGVHG